MQDPEAAVKDAVMLPAPDAFIEGERASFKRAQDSNAEPKVEALEERVASARR